MAEAQYPMKIAMVSVFVADPAKAFIYYTETLGFEKVMYDPDNYLAIVKSSLDPDGVTLLLEPTEPGGIEIARRYKAELYKMGMPVISFSSEDIEKTVIELKEKDLTKTDYGYDAVFDDDNGNYIQLLQLN